MVMMKMLVAMRGAVGTVFAHADSSVIATAHSARAPLAVENFGVVKSVLLPPLTRIRYRPPQKGGWHLFREKCQPPFAPDTPFPADIGRPFVRISRDLCKKRCQPPFPGRCQPPFQALLTRRGLCI